jgi:hypothetical protein
LQTGSIAKAAFLGVAVPEALGGVLDPSSLIRAPLSIQS